MIQHAIEPGSIPRVEKAHAVPRNSLQTQAVAVVLVVQHEPFELSPSVDGGCIHRGRWCTRNCSHGSSCCLRDLVILADNRVHQDYFFLPIFVTKQNVLLEPRFLRKVAENPDREWRFGRRVIRLERSVATLEHEDGGGE